MKENMRIKINKNDGGFTLLEVILVLIFISIFATIAVSRQSNPDVSLTAAAEVLKAHIRYAQMRAMNSNIMWGVHAEAGTTYWLFNSADTGNRQFFPGENEDNVDIGADGISISQGEGVTSFTVSFDHWGVPSVVPSVSGPVVITLSKDSQTNQISIIQNTGFVR